MNNKRTSSSSTTTNSFFAISSCCLLLSSLNLPNSHGFLPPTVSTSLIQHHHKHSNNINNLLYPRTEISTWYNCSEPTNVQNYRYLNNNIVGDKNDSNNNKYRLVRRQTNSNNNLVSSIFFSKEWQWLTWMGIPFSSLRSLATKEPSHKLSIGLSRRECILSLLLYLSVGVCSFSFLFEKWPIVDSLYFSVVCLTTVGYGDLCPKTSPGKLFAAVFGLGGILFSGAAVARICSSFVQAEIDARSKTKNAAQLLWSGASFQEQNNILERLQQVKRLKDNNNNNLDNVHEQEVGGQVIQQLSSKAAEKNGGGAAVEIVIKSIPAFLFVLLGGIIMGKLNKDWNWAQSIYYAFITGSTIGLGDLTPQTQAAKMFAIGFIPLSVVACGHVLSNLATVLIERRQKRVFQNLLLESSNRLVNLDHQFFKKDDHSEDVSREEYVYFMLLEMGVITQKELDELLTQFDTLDVTHSGYLDQEDLALLHHNNNGVV